MSSPPQQQTQLQELAYNAINTYFKAHSHEIVEIEVLPPALEPPDNLILKDGTNLGLPKKVLALAYVHARHLFFARKDSKSIGERIQAHDSTRVILLFDPEHLTAANYRKRYLLSLDGDGEAFVDAAWAELRFLNSILTSPLHRQSKSPTLWAHRAWWLTYISPKPLTSSHDMLAFFKGELEAVMKSGERHPKNYYAWQYARRLVCKTGESLGGNAWEAFVMESMDAVVKWCQAHPSDISGFAFLTWLLCLAGVPQERARIVDLMVTYAVDVRLTNESLWTFVRTMLANGLVEEQIKMKIFSVMGEHSERPDGGQFEERVAETLAWIMKNGTKEDSPKIRTILSKSN